MVEYRSLTAALSAFCSGVKPQSQAHVKPLHYYGAVRLVLEGGFLECQDGGARVYPHYPPGGSPVHFGGFFQRLYRAYDERYPFMSGDTPLGRLLSRKQWVPDRDQATASLELSSTQDPDSSFPYQVRLG